ncbi:hypothetical protein NUW54_g11672 [Trametes sanguinea]|uniref:Uncharacterized protein n=1 Tax=Trametes sanguinea TaxID=158606 RepID=A0ACC1N904_9APHY|nr:hypothetical protein NUW54_g11672 [Trametes sanguinea]
MIEYPPLHLLIGPLPPSFSGQAEGSLAAPNPMENAGSAYDSLYEMYAGDSRGQMLSAESPGAGGSQAQREAIPEAGPALEVIEMANGETIWSIVNGLRDDDGESFYGDRASFYSEYSVKDTSENVKLFFKEHERKSSKGSTSSFLSRKKPQQPKGTARPETKVFFSSSQQIGRLIENLSRGMDAGSFNIMPGQASASQGHVGHSTASSIGSEADMRWTVEERLEHMLGAISLASDRSSMLCLEDSWVYTFNPPVQAQREQGVSDEVVFVKAVLEEGRAILDSGAMEKSCVVGDTTIFAGRDEIAHRLSVRAFDDRPEVGAECPVEEGDDELLVVRHLPPSRDRARRQCRARGQERAGASRARGTRSANLVGPLRRSDGRSAHRGSGALRKVDGVELVYDGLVAVVPDRDTLVAGVALAREVELVDDLALHAGVGMRRRAWTLIWTTSLLGRHHGATHFTSTEGMIDVRALLQEAYGRHGSMNANVARVLQAGHGTYLEEHLFSVILGPTAADLSDYAGEISLKG